MSAVDTQRAARAALVSRFAAAWEDGDVEALMELMAEDCTFRASVGPEPGATFAGREEVRRGFEQFLAAGRAGPKPETISEPPLISADFAVTRWTSCFQAADGSPLLVRACDVFGFEGDRIKFKDTYRKVSG